MLAALAIEATVLSADTALPAASISAFTIRPRGPLPDNLVKSTLFCAANLRAKGVAKMRAPSAALSAAAGGADAGEEASVADLAGLDVAASAAGAGLAGALGAASTSEEDSPSSSKTAIALFTATFSVPSATKSLPMMPSSTASNSIVALSVSISASKSPEATASPSFTNHLASVPSSIVGDSAGIKISIGMIRSP